MGCPVTSSCTGYGCGPCNSTEAPLSCGTPAQYGITGEQAIDLVACCECDDPLCVAGFSPCSAVRCCDSFGNVVTPILSSSSPGSSSSLTVPSGPSSTTTAVVGLLGLAAIAGVGLYLFERERPVRNPH